MAIIVEPKLNGFRGILNKKGNRAELYFEGQLGKNQLKKFPQLEKEILKIKNDFVFDADISIQKDGKRLPRPNLMRLNADNPQIQEDEKVVLTAFDAPFIKKDISSLSLEERRDKLERFYNSLAIDKSMIKISPLKLANTVAELKVAVKWAFNQDRSEGAMAKTLDAEYPTGGTSEWFKLKRIAELKVIVLDRIPTKTQGVYNYFIGLSPSVGDVWENTTILKGKAYINLGKTFNSKIKAEPGQILTISILELIPNEENKTLSLLGGNVIDIDSTRKNPYTTDQAIDISQRRKVLQKSLEGICPGHGPKNAKIAFVGLYPSKIDSITKTHLSGVIGEIFKEKYLKNLGLEKENVFISTIYPASKENFKKISKGEIIDSINILYKDLEELENPIIVALGQNAKKILKDKANFVLPHPEALYLLGDSGEVYRKSQQIRKELVKQQTIGEEGGDIQTRGEMATKFWEDNWQNMYPKSGKGKFVFQNHWRGLDEEEAKTLSNAQLLDTDNSLHGDLRFSNNTDELWGFSVFLGSAGDNKKAGGNKLFSLGDDDVKNLRGTFKLAQPKQWLDVASKKPYISEPGGAGSTSQKWSKFIEMDKGNYEIGIWHKHLFEIFLKGKNLKGRYLIQSVPMEGGRIWLMDKPKDQTPIAQQKSREDLIKERKARGDKWLVWNNPDDNKNPELIELDKVKIEKDVNFEIIAKTSSEKKLVYGIVLEPEVIDAHEDIVSIDEIEKTAHFYMLNSQVVGNTHKKQAEAKVVESYIAPVDFTISGQKVKKGSWVLVVKVLDDKIWEKIKNKEFTGFSMGGFGKRIRGVDHGE